MKLPDKCPHLRSARHWVPHYEDAAPCCRIDDFDLPVFLSRQGPICRDISHTVEAYRFIWRSTFHGDALVHIARSETNINLEWVYRGRNGQGRFWKSIEHDDWTRLETALLAADFWAVDLEEKSDVVRLNGAKWVIEGRRREVYRVVRRDSPHGPIHDLGRAFLDIAGPPIATIALY